MPDNYSNADFSRMQEQAIKRVREMQQKAQTPKEPPKMQNEQQNNTQFQQQRRNERPNIYQAKPQQRRDMPREAPKEQKKDVPKETNVFQNEKERMKNQNPFSSLLHLDSDMSLILSLALFLGKEGADDMLILALLYIMS